jgi:PAS domain S-box-containing protein
VAFVATRILGASDWREEIEESLRRIGEASRASRCYLFENETLANGVLASSVIFEWAEPGVVPSIDQYYNQHYPYEGGYQEWVDALSAGRAVQGPIDSFPEDVRISFEREGVLSTAAVPVRVDGRWWGYLGFDDCVRRRDWSEAEIRVLETAAAVIASAIEGLRSRQSLRRSEVRQQQLIESLPTVIYRCRLEDRDSVYWVSPQYERLLGYTPEERLAQPRLWEKLVHPDDLDAVLRESERTRASRIPFSMEYRMYARDGRLLWVRDESTVVLNDDGRPSEWLGVITDITERKGAEEEAIRRGVILEAIAFGAERFLNAVSWRDVIDEVLGRLGEATGASRCRVFQNDPLEDATPASTIRWEWCAPGVPPTIDLPENQQEPYTGGFADWATRMERGEVVHGPVSSFEPDVRASLGITGVLSIAAVPILAEGKWWGFLGFDDCGHEREWSEPEIQILSTAAATVGASIEGEGVRERLRESEVIQRNLIESLPVVVYRDTLDSSDSILYLSPQYESLFGYSPEERRARPGLWREMVHPDDREMLEAASEESRRSRARFALEYRVHARDGRLLWVRDEAVLLPDEDGNPTQWLGVITDLTERRLAEERAIRQGDILEAVAFGAERFLNSARWQDCIDEVLGHLGGSARVSRCYIYENYRDDAGRGRSKLTHEWAAPGVPSDLDQPRDHDYDRERDGFPRWQRLLSSGSSIHGVVADMPEMERPDLEQAGILSIAVVPIFVSGEWWGYLGFDDTETAREWNHAEVEALKSAAALLGSAIQRNRAEQKLRQAEEENRSIVETIPVVVYRDAIDSHSTTLYVSPYVQQLLGYSTQERLAQPQMWAELLHPDDRETVLEYSEKTNRTLEPFEADYRLIHRDGHVVWVHDESTIVYDDDGAPLYWQGVLVDITDAKRAQEELQRALELEREAAEGLRALDEMKNTFLTAVSHDLRTPLAAVLGLALTLEREDMALDASESRDLAKRIAANARKLDRLVTDLLDLDRLSRGIVEPQLTTTDIGLIARKVVREADFMQKHPVVVEAETVIARVDSTKVERILENLLSNSARHTPSGTEVWVRVWAEDGNAIIAVEDAGPGVLAELKQAVFEPFRQGPDSGLPSPGVGIGLSLVARFAELHGGRAWVQDREGGGASFRVSIPMGTVSVPVRA